MRRSIGNIFLEPRHKEDKRWILEHGSDIHETDDFDPLTTSEALISVYVFDKLRNPILKPWKDCLIIKLLGFKVKL